MRMIILSNSKVIIELSTNGLLYNNCGEKEYWSGLLILLLYAC